MLITLLEIALRRVDRKGEGSTLTDPFPIMHGALDSIGPKLDLTCSIQLSFDVYYFTTRRSAFHANCLHHVNRSRSGQRMLVSPGQAQEKIAIVSSNGRNALKHFGQKVKVIQRIL